jgi:hypothetical protein
VRDAVPCVLLGDHAKPEEDVGDNVPPACDKKVFFGRDAVPCVLLGGQAKPEEDVGDNVPPARNE